MVRNTKPRAQVFDSILKIFADRAYSNCPGQASANRNIHASNIAFLSVLWQLCLKAKYGPRRTPELPGVLIGLIMVCVIFGGAYYIR